LLMNKGGNKDEARGSQYNLEVANNSNNQFYLKVLLSIDYRASMSSVTKSSREIWQVARKRKVFIQTDTCIFHIDPILFM